MNHTNIVVGFTFRALWIYRFAPGARYESGDLRGREM
jgi:hypothetical protein